ncbi:MAG: extracellular solute-binding protein [Paracoccus sp. (in: a-proteobacteria)]|nr:extracellular solute-binding protein [Paracoccus sp. (in: a-proteobacteria)]
MTQTARLAALMLPLSLMPLAAQEAAPGAAGGDVTVSHAIAIFGEPALPADFEHLPYVNPDAPKGGEISIAFGGGFDSFNPYTVKGRAEAMSNIMIEDLMTGTADEIGTAYCLICETIEYPASRDWVIFNLRPEARFSDGSAVTADDVLFSYETLRDKGLSSFRRVFAQSVAGAEVLDTYRIRFDFVPGYPRRDVIAGVGSLPVFSRADFESTGRDLGESNARPMVGSGPYMFGRMDMGRTAVWKRNPDYWGRDLPINRGRHNFDRIRVEYFADSDAAFEAFKAGEYTIRNETNSMSWATGYDFPGVANGYVIRAEIPEGDKAPAQGFFFNLRRDKFQDPRLREAIGLMFNFEWSNRALFYDLYARTQSFWENSDLKAEGPPSAEELALLAPLADDLPEGILTQDAILPPVSGERQLDRGNQRRAGALLDAAGWVPGQSGGMRRNAEGQPLTVEFLSDSPVFERVINPFVENLRAIGVDARLVRVDDSEYQNRRARFDYDIIIGHAQTSMIASDGLYQVFGTQGADDVFNVAGLSNPAIDALIGAAVAAETEAEMAVATHALDRSLRAMRIWVPNWFKPMQTLAYYDQYDRPENPPPYIGLTTRNMWYLDFWWYNAEKAEKLRAAGALR